MNFDAIMLCSYGGPRGMDDVLPFMRNATRGRGVPDERLIQVSGHYKLFNGVSPINARNEELRAAIAQRVEVPVVIGNRNWSPYFVQTLAELDQRGLHRVLCVFTSAFASYSGCRQYREDIAAAVIEIGAQDRFQLFKIPPYYEADGFLAANVSAAYAAMEGDDDAHLLLVTHSIPVVMNENSGPASAKKTYLEQHRALGQKLCSELSEKLGRKIDCDLAFCSRSGPAHQKWLEPDINDRLHELSEQGVRSVVVLPFGFITDHMEVVYDLDTEARNTAAELGMRFQRAATAGTNVDFVDSLVKLINGAAERVNTAQRGEQQRGEVSWPAHCETNCCLPCDGYQLRATEFDQISAPDPRERKNHV
ncbi:ferrochelatase [Arcanobacterium pluranimalium]|uniref:ferrochelatase n=1 Tax=Arcanobacterium pluranimalium TaxID=108028 RepID=UPI00195A5AFD|nr:ferrochelatase [Arcanobacterium pluranimalium]MBM7825182.1 ferrochelatase [Arcanobacterium pluranimalium]